MKTKYIKIFSVFFLSIFLFLPIIIYSAEPRYKIPELQIPIDTVKLSEVSCYIENGNEICEIAWVGEYIKGIYEYSVSIVAILATVVLMASGLMWLTSGGSQEKIGQAKNMIIGSIVGIILLLGSYTILNLINPELTAFPSISMGVIPELEGDSSDIRTRYINEETVAMISNALGINCDEETIRSIYGKTRGNVIYNQERRLNLAPGNKVYFDCSSYASYLLYCSNINKSLPAWTGAIFSESQSTAFSDNIQLKVGDLVGWPASGDKAGHVYIYIGDNVFIHAQSGRRAVTSANKGQVKNTASRHNAQLYYRSGSN